MYGIGTEDEELNKVLSKNNYSLIKEALESRSLTLEDSYKIYVASDVNPVVDQTIVNSIFISTNNIDVCYEIAKKNRELVFRISNHSRTSPIYDRLYNLKFNFSRLSQEEREKQITLIEFLLEGYGLDSDELNRGEGYYQSSTKSLIKSLVEENKEHFQSQKNRYKFIKALGGEIEDKIFDVI